MAIATINSINALKRTLARIYYDPAWATPLQLEALTQIDEPLLAQARDVICAGRDAVIAVTDRALYDLLCEILTEHAPTSRAIQRRRIVERRIAEAAGKATVGDLANELWPDSTMAWYADPDAGTGEWPKPPKRTNEEATPEGTVMVIRAAAEGIRIQMNPRYKRLWRTDDREMYFRVKRAVQQAHAEMAFQEMFLHEFEDVEGVKRALNTWRAAERRAKERGQELPRLVYAAYEFEADKHMQFAVVCNREKGAVAPIPADRTEAMLLFSRLLNTPEGVRLSRHSQGYGHQFQGMKGDGRAAMIRKELKANDQVERGGHKAFQLLTQKPFKEVAAVMNWLDDKEVIPTSQIKNYLRTLKEFDPDLKVRGGHALSHIETRLVQQCTQLRETQKTEKNVSTSCVQPAVEREANGLPEPFLFARQARE